MENGADAADFVDGFMRHVNDSLHVNGLKTAGGKRMQFSHGTGRRLRAGGYGSSRFIIGKWGRGIRGDVRQCAAGGGDWNPACVRGGVSLCERAVRGFRRG